MTEIQETDQSDTEEAILTSRTYHVCIAQRNGNAGFPSTDYIFEAVRDMIREMGWGHLYGVDYVSYTENDDEELVE